MLRLAWQHDADKQNHHGVVGGMLTVTHETRAEKGDAKIDRAPIDLGLCPLSPIAVFVDQCKTAQSHSFVEESFHLTENWSTRRRARYFHAPPARSHGAFWVGDTEASGKSRHPICYSNSPPKSSRRHSGTPSVRHQPRRNP